MLVQLALLVYWELVLLTCEHRAEKDEQQGPVAISVSAVMVGYHVGINMYMVKKGLFLFA